MMNLAAFGQTIKRLDNLVVGNQQKSVSNPVVTNSLNVKISHTLPARSTVYNAFFTSTKNFIGSYYVSVYGVLVYNSEPHFINQRFYVDSTILQHEQFSISDEYITPVKLANNFGLWIIACPFDIQYGLDVRITPVTIAQGDIQCSITQEGNKQILYS